MWHDSCICRQLAHQGAMPFAELAQRHLIVHTDMLQLFIQSGLLFFLLCLIFLQIQAP